MSLDMPFYEELKRQGHPAARPWFVGDCLYYLGLLPAFLALIVGALAIIGALVGGSQWLYVWIALGVFVAGVTVFFAGGMLKARSYKMAARDGIHVNDY